MKRFYFIDKPLGVSSFDIIRTLRKILNTRKIGHTGTLDPLATGGMILAVGDYTKLISYLEKDAKEYEFEVSLDGVTDSFDLGEEIQFISEEEKQYYKDKLTIDLIQDIINEKFSGNIKQVPPKYSALKINGKKAYQLAREGVEVEMKTRDATVFDIEILSFEYPKLSIRVKVSAGTYVRSIAHDLGQELGCGGYVTKLRRTKIGNLEIKDSQKLEDFDENDILDISKIFSHITFIDIDDELLEKMNVGLKVNGEFPYKVGEDLFVEKDGTITNILEYNGEKLYPKRRI